MTRLHIDEAARLRRQVQALITSLNKAQACMTCGAPAVTTIDIGNGCAVFPDVRGKIHLCAQHAVKIDLLEGNGDAQRQTETN